MIEQHRPAVALDFEALLALALFGDVPDPSHDPIHGAVRENPAGFGNCYPTIFYGPSRPTPTPLPQPQGDCGKSVPLTFDLADVEDPYSLGTFSATRTGAVTIRVDALSFESGHSTADQDSGFSLAIVEEIADAHDWAVTVTESTDGGARFEITGVEQITGQ